MSSTPVFSGIHVAQSLVFYVMFCRSPFVIFLLTIVLSVILLFMASDYPFDIFKIFLNSDGQQCQQYQQNEQMPLIRSIHEPMYHVGGGFDRIDRNLFSS